MCAVGVGVLGALVVSPVRGLARRRHGRDRARTGRGGRPRPRVNVGAMFLSDHDAAVARLVLVLSSVPAVVLAVLLGRHAPRRRAVGGEQARALAAGLDRPAAGPVTAELAELGAELARTRASLEASRAREQALESARRQVLAFVSHDLRSPLSGIRATVDGLRDGVLVDTGPAYAGIETAINGSAG